MTNELLTSAAAERNKDPILTVLESVLPKSGSVLEIAFSVNEKTENIGARRLHTVMERLLESVSFDAAENGGSAVHIDAAYVDQHLGVLAKDEDLSRYIL